MLHLGGAEVDALAQQLRQAIVERHGASKGKVASCLDLFDSQGGGELTADDFSDMVRALVPGSHIGEDGSLLLYSCYTILLLYSYYSVLLLY